MALYVLIISLGIISYENMDMPNDIVPIRIASREKIALRLSLNKSRMTFLYNFPIVS